MIKYVLLFIFVQFIIAIALGVSAFRKGRVMPFQKMAIIALIPIIGLFIPYIGVLFGNRREEGDEDLEDVFGHHSEDLSSDIQYEKLIEMDKELNLVPVEEALLLNDSTVKRKLILEAEKQDALEYISFLKLAMADRDMETSHYAASIIMEINRGLQNVIQKAMVAYEKDRTNIENLVTYVEIVGKYYQSGFLDEHNELRYGFLYSGLLKELIELGYYTDDLFKEKIETDIKLKEYGQLFYWIDLYHEKYPECERPYLLKMRYYYITNNMTGIVETLGALENSHVNISHEGNEIIKFWTSKVA